MRGTGATSAVNRSLSGDTKDALANELPANEKTRLILAAALLAYGVHRADGWVTRRLSIARALHRLVAHATIQKDRGHSSFTVRYGGSPLELAPLEATKRSPSLRRMELRGAFLACGLTFGEQTRRLPS